MAAKTSAGLITFGVINIVVALLPPCAGCLGTTFFFSEPHLPIKNRDVGPQFKQHLDREVPTAKGEAIGAVVCNSFLCLLLVAGAVGLFMTQSWARWLSVGVGILLIL